MLRNPLFVPVLAAGCALAGAAVAQDRVSASASTTTTLNRAPAFTAPVRLEAAGKVIRVENPGYAAPCWADVDQDGRKDLVVGQFHGGKMKVYRGLKDGKLAAGKWLEAEGETAEVPGVW